MCSLKPFFTLPFFVRFVVSFEAIMPEYIEEAVDKLIILGKAFLAGDVHTGHRIVCLDLNELVPE
jgi:hypothetical protein